MDIQALVTAQRAYFSTGATLPLSARKTALKRLQRAIRAHEADILAALRSDLNKSPAESYMCEVGLTLSELSFVEKRLARWMGDRPHLTPLAPVPRPELYRVGALRGCPDYVPMELPLHAHYGAPHRGHRRRKLLHGEAIGLLPRRLRGHPGYSVKLLPSGACRRCGGRKGGESGPSGPEI